MIKQIYNRLKEKRQLRQKQKEIFEKTQIGDVLWCSMPLSKRELRKIEISHRNRPYLVVKKEKNFLLCYQSSSKNRENINNYEKYAINSGKYKNKKTSWIDLRHIKKIKIKNIQSEFMKLNQIDIKKIEKRICMRQNNGNHQIIRFQEPIYIEEGDVITKENKSYYVYAGDNVNVYCFRIQKKKNKNQKFEKIKINTRSYYTDFKELRVINRKEEIGISNIANKEEILLILDQKKTLKANTYNKIEESIKRENNKFEIGSVFQYGKSTVMYLYCKANKYYGVDLLWYTIKPRVFEIKEIQNRKLVGSKDLKEINKILECLTEKSIQNSEIENIYQYVRNLLFSSVAN